MEIEEDIRPWKQYPLWDEWMAEQVQAKMRQVTFVITGPSKLGKSEFVRASIVPLNPERVLMVSCMNVLDPDLRDFNEAEHDGIVFDEGSADMIQRHRDLFQAPRHEIKLAHSQTGCYCYKVNVWRTKLIVTSNSFFEQLDALPSAHAAWVRANTKVLEVTENMWQ